MKKKIVVGLIAAMALIVMGGCGSKKEENIASKDYIFRYEELPASKEFRDGATLAVAGDNVYLYGTVWDEFYMNSELVVARLTEDGEIAERVRFQVPQNTYYGSLTGSSDGRLFATKTVYPSYDDNYYGDEDIDVMPLIEGVGAVGSLDSNENDMLHYDDLAVDNDNGLIFDEAEIPLAMDLARVASISDSSVAVAYDYGGDYVYQPDQYYLVELGLDGTEKQSILLNENRELNATDYFYINQVIGVAGNKLVVSAMDKFAVYETNGNYLGLLNLELGDNSWGGNFINLRDGRTLWYYYHDQTLKFAEIDINTGALGNEYELEGNVYNYSVHPGAGYDLFVSDNSDLYGYNLGAEPVRLMNYVDSDLNIYSLYNVFALDVGRFWSMIYDSGETRNYFAQFTKVRPEDVVDKIGLVLAGSYIDWEIRNHVVKFNKSNDKYRISLVDYGNLYNTGDDWMAGVTRLNTDIATGRAPDILTITSDLPIGSYMAKGLFADFLPFIEKDAELNVNDLMPNVVEAYSMNGKLFRLAPQFGVGTVFAKTSLVGATPGWTLADVRALQARFPEASLFDMMARPTMMYYAMTYNSDKFVDWEKGLCHFNSDAFIHLLEFMKEFPEEIDYSVYDRSDYWVDWESNYRMDRTLLMMSQLGNLRDYNRFVKGNFGEDVTMIGFPVEEGNGAALVTYQSFAMSARSKNLDGAWEFLRYYLSDEYQETSTWMFPISRKNFDKKAREAMERPYYLDMDGERVEYDDTYYLAGQEILITPLTEAERERIVDYILSVNSAGEYDDALVSIINEEAESFFAGQKTAREVVEIIQSRAQIYVNENK